uniref:Heart development protein with EGF like domains 1 n=1 Tax=Pipistrellus kuhlii TaxID=59472 RepID=A0A7J8A6L1_PIPKU|nr:heart development protein with EGF like domains 1 [Pipistrellus kuhlii]
MAPPRAPRGPPPLPPLLLLLLLLPAAPGARGQPSPPARRPPEPGPGREPLPPAPPPTAPPGPRRAAPAPDAAAPRGGSAAAVRNHTGTITFDQNQVGFSTLASKEGVKVQTPDQSHAPSDAPENSTPHAETAGAGGTNRAPRRTKAATSPAGPQRATALPSPSSTSALGRLSLPASSPGSKGGSAPSHPESRTSWGSLAREKGLPKEVTVQTQVATSVLSQASRPAVETGEEASLPRKGNSSEPELSWLLSSRTWASSPPSGLSAASGSMDELNHSTAPQSPWVSWAKSVQVATTFPSGVPRGTPSLAVSAGQLSDTESLSEDAEATPTSASAHSSPAVAELRRNAGMTGRLGDGTFSEASTENGFGLTSSEVSAGLWQNDSPVSEGPPQASGSDERSGSPLSHTESVSGPVPLGGAEESTAHWMLTNGKAFEDVTGSSTSYPGVVNSSVLTQFSASAPQPGGSDGALGAGSDAELATESSSSSSSESLESSAPRGERSITGIIYHPAIGTDPEQGPSSHHPDHTYVSSTFTKGERALLSITDNSSSPDAGERSTASAKISNSSEAPSPPQGQTERRNASSLSFRGGGAGAPPATESLGLHTAHPPPYTPATNTSGAWDLPGTRTGRDSDSPPSSGPPLPPPSVSQPHRSSSSFSSSTSSSSRASAHPPEATPDAPTPLPSSPPPSPASLTVPAPVSVSVSQATLSPSSLTLALPRARDTPVTAVRPATVASSVAVLSHSQTADPENQSNPHHAHAAAASAPPRWESPPTEAAGADTASSASGAPGVPALPASSTEPTLPAASTSVARTPPAWTATAPTAPPPLVPTPDPSSSTATPVAGPTAGRTAAGEPPLPTSPDTPAPRVPTEAVVTTQRSRVPVVGTTPGSALTSAPASATVLTAGGPASPVLRTSPAPRSTHAAPADMSSPRGATSRAQSGTPAPTAPSSPASANGCAPNPCRHGGKCVVDPALRGHRCVCSASWQGEDCSVDVNECLSNPCPPLAACNNTQGSFTCRCPIGYQLEKGICNLVRTFVTEFKLKKTFPNSTVERHSDLREVENEVTSTLNMCFSVFPGYTRSTVRASGESGAVALSLQTTFSLASNVTLFDLADGTQRCANSCRSSAEVCQLLGSQRRIFRAGSLCKRKTPECDKETSVCTDLDGVALCQCKAGYFQFNKMDHSCRACEDGYRLENETCMSCPFGLGGLNCGNPYQLITVVIAAAGGGLLLILGIALIVTCCRKNKNDISKLIFKSGDFQMSPYAEYPKNPRSQEWGREAIEMHENGSTKNLLQMTDVYYSPTSVRNPELERNGLYPAYTGLPGSRHSCIFPGQYNPSFISDESRRRDYF